MYSIEIQLAQNLTEEDYQDVANQVQDAIECLNCTVTQTYEDGTTEDEDLIQGVYLVKKEEVSLDMGEDSDEANN